MTRRMKRIVDVIDEMRRMATRINILQLQFARYKDRYMVAKDEPIWHQKVNEINRSLRNLKDTFRRNEFTVNMILDQEKRAIKAYFLYERIELMLPHLNTIKLESGKVYQIKIAKGEVIIKELYGYDNRSNRQLMPPGTLPPSPTYLTMTVRNSETSRTSIKDNTIIIQGVTSSIRGKDPRRVINHEIAETTVSPKPSNQNAQRILGEKPVTVINKMKYRKNQDIPQPKTLPMELRTRRPKLEVTPASETIKTTNRKGPQKEKVSKVTKDQKSAGKSHKAMSGLNVALTTIGILIGIILTLGMGWKIRKDIKKLKEKRQLRIARGMLKRQRRLSNNLKKRVSFAGDHGHVTTTH